MHDSPQSVTIRLPRALVCLHLFHPQPIQVFLYLVGERVPGGGA